MSWLNYSLTYLKIILHFTIDPVIVADSHATTQITSAALSETEGFCFFTFA